MAQSTEFAVLGAGAWGTAIALVLAQDTQHKVCLWSARPEKRNLPAWWEWPTIRLFTRPRDWTPSQWQMMRQADRFYLLCGGLVALAVAVVTFNDLIKPA